MSLPRYACNKDSGVQWLGNIPQHWAVVRARHLLEIRKRIAGVHGHTVLSVTQQGIKPKDTESGEGQLSDDYSKYQLVEVGDFAMNHMDLLTGYVDISRYLGVTSPDYRVFVIRDTKTCWDRYFLYLFQMGYRNKIFFAFGQGSSQLGRWRLPTEEFNSFLLPVPPISEQRVIADFLDRETAKIDALIAEQQRLIELLAEKRHALISHTVTKGLNPAAPMKDSGIEWLGAVPTLWRITRVKYILATLTDFTANGSFASLAANVSYLTDGFSRLVRLTDLRENLKNEGVYVDEAAHKYLSKSELFGGEVLIANVGAYAGYACEMPFVGRKATLGPNMYLMRFNADATSNHFLFLSINAAYMKEQLLISSTATAQPKLNKDDVKTCFVVLPPLDEQQQVIDYLRVETYKIDKLCVDAELAVNLLQERRISLISAAVTGKIDVRGLVSSPPDKDVAA